MQKLYHPLVEHEKFPLPENYIDFTDDTLGSGHQFGNLQWKVNSGNTPTNGTGPEMSRDHLPHLSLLPLEGIRIGNIMTLDYSIPQMKNGKYVYAEMSGGQPGDQAVLWFNTSAKCMRFHYSAFGYEVGVFDIFQGDSTLLMRPLTNLLTFVKKIFSFLGLQSIYCSKW